MDLRYILYDTAAVPLAAAQNVILFQNGEGSAAAFVESVTNMRGSGSLPSSEKFVAQMLYCWPETELAEADLHTFWAGALIEIKVLDQTLLKIPARLALYSAAFGGHFTQVAAANRTAIGPEAYGYSLNPSIEIPGATRFSVRFYKNAAAAGIINVKVALDGILTLP